MEVGENRHAAEQCIEIARLRQANDDVPGALEALDEALSLDSSNRLAQILRSELGEDAPPAAPAEPDVAIDFGGPAPVSESQPAPWDAPAAPSQAASAPTPAPAPVSEPMPWDAPAAPAPRAASTPAPTPAPASEPMPWDAPAAPASSANPWDAPASSTNPWDAAPTPESSVNPWDAAPTPEPSANPWDADPMAGIGLDAPSESQGSTVTPAPGGSGLLGGAPVHDTRLKVDQLIAEGQAYQKAGKMNSAIQSYEEALERGGPRTDVDYSLGLLIQEQGQHERAVELLRRAAADDEYALSARFALGQSLRALGRTRLAAEEFESTIRLVDLDTINRAEADDLISMYEAAGDAYAELGELSRAASLYGTLASFLGGKRWGRELSEQYKAKARELTERSMFAKLRAMGTGTLGQPLETPVDAVPDPAATSPQVWGSLPSLSDFLKADGGGDAELQTPAQQIDPFAALDLPEVGHAMFAPVTPLPTEGLSEALGRFVAASERFIEQGLIYAAMDACHEVMRIEPDYLPIHLRLGEIYEREGRTEEALVKYRTLVDTYVARQKEVEAIDVYYRLIELSPDTIMARSQLAELLRKAGRTDDAIGQALMVANTFFKMGQSNRALEEFRRLQQWAPRSAAIHKEYGQALLKLERWEAALAEFRQAVQLDAQDPVALAQLNMTMAVIGQQERQMWDSLAALIDKVRSEPQHLAAVQSEYRAAMLIVDTPILSYILGLIQQVAGQHASAMLSFEQALSLLMMDEHPQISAMLIHQAMAESYIAENQAQEAIDQLHIAQQLFIEQPLVINSMHPFARPLTESEIQRRLAAALASMQDWPGAIKALETCLQLDPSDFAAYPQLADIYFRQGKLSQALEQYEKLATAYEDRQQLDQAIATLEDAIKFSPNTTSIRARLAQLLIRRGLLDRGLSELQEVAILHKNAGQTKDAVLAMQQAAEVYWMLGQHERVYKIYGQIIQIAPNDIEARQQLVNMHILSGRRPEAIAEQRRIAQLCTEQQNYNEAIASWHQIIALDPNDAPAYEQLGDVLMRVKEFDQAVRLFKRLVRLRPNDEHVQALQAAAERMLAMQGKPGGAA